MLAKATSDAYEPVVASDIPPTSSRSRSSSQMLPMSLT